MLGVSPSTVWYWVNKAGIRQLNRTGSYLSKYSESVRQHAIWLYLQGFTIKEVSIETRCKNGAVSRWIHSSGFGRNPGLKGSLSHRWRGGQVYERINIMNTREYKKWRTDVYRRDGFKCVSCDSVGDILHAHHILSYAKYPDKRLDIDNGVTLCVECHRNVHRKNKKKVS